MCICDNTKKYCDWQLYGSVFTPFISTYWAALLPPTYLLKFYFSPIQSMILYILVTSARMLNPLNSDLEALMSCLPPWAFCAEWVYLYLRMTRAGCWDQVQQEKGGKRVWEGRAKSQVEKGATPGLCNTAFQRWCHNVPRCASGSLQDLQHQINTCWLKWACCTLFCLIKLENCENSHD